MAMTSYCYWLDLEDLFKNLRCNSVIFYLHNIIPMLKTEITKTKYLYNTVRINKCDLIYIFLNFYILYPRKYNILIHNICMMYISFRILCLFLTLTYTIFIDYYNNNIVHTVIVGTNSKGTHLLLNPLNNNNKKYK